MKQFLRGLFKFSIVSIGLVVFGIIAVFIDVYDAIMEFGKEQKNDD